MAEESTITLFAMNKTKKSFLKFPTYTVSVSALPYFSLA